MGTNGISNLRIGVFTGRNYMQAEIALFCYNQYTDQWNSFGEYQGTLFCDQNTGVPVPLAANCLAAPNQWPRVGIYLPPPAVNYWGEPPASSLIYQGTGVSLIQHPKGTLAGASWWTVFRLGSPPNYTYACDVTPCFQIWTDDAYTSNWFICDASETQHFTNIA